MAIKLYQWDVSKKDVLASPNKFDNTFEIKWWQHGYVSMTEGFAVLFNELNDNLLVKSDADGVTAVKAYYKQTTDNLKVSRIRAKYTVDDEFFSIRTNNTEIKNDITAIVAQVETELNAWLDVS